MIEKRSVVGIVYYRSCAANISTKKRKVLVKGKYKNLWCFKNIKLLPVTYKTNKSSRPILQFFEEEVKKWDTEFMGWIVLLLVDNCSTHPCVSVFSANTTSVL